jgi:hypothetical protein
LDIESRIPKLCDGETVVAPNDRAASFRYLRRSARD